MNHRKAVVKRPITILHYPLRIRSLLGKGDDSGRFGMLRDQGFHHVQNFLLLTAGQLGDGFKYRARLATRLDHAPGRIKGS